MTHFIAAVAVPPSVDVGFEHSPTEYPTLYGEGALETAPSESLNDYLNRALAKFDENTSVEQVIPRAEVIATKRAEIELFRTTTYAEWLELGEAAYREKYKPSELHIEYLKNEFSKRLTWTEEQVHAEAVKYEDPENILADGSVQSYYNPNSKWDWWTIGGRWEREYRERQGELVTALISNLEAIQAARADEAQMAALVAQEAVMEQARKAYYGARREALRQFPDGTPDAHVKQEKFIRDADDLLTEEWNKLQAMSAYIGWSAPHNVVVPTDAELFKADTTLTVEEGKTSGEIALSDGDGVVDPRTLPFEWLEIGRTGWWGLRDDTMSEDEWIATLKGALEKLPPESKIVYLDLHI